MVDVESLRAEVRDEYRAVAVAPTASYHFHTGGAGGGEASALAYEVFGHPFSAVRA